MPPKSAKELRAARLASALKENLKRRKAQARMRQRPAGEEGAANKPTSGQMGARKQE